MTRITTIFLALVIAAAVSGGQNTDTPPPSLSVTGKATLELAPDQLQITLGVLTESPTANEAAVKNAELMRSVIAAVKDQGISDKEYATGRFRVDAVWSRPARGSQEVAKITGYSVTNTIIITTLQLNIASDLIGAATDAGANRVDQVTFSMADPRDGRGDAITLAAKNAIEDARTLASATGTRLGRVMTLSIGSANVTPYSVGREYYATPRMSVDAGTAPPIKGGEVTVNATVHITFELHSNHTTTP
jgi:hypothetical protein